jgi:large subunit ribosomal protein L35
MAYKLKPNKCMLSRFKVTKTGKLKRHHAKTSHLMSGRRAKKKRQLGRPAIVFEGIARNLRRAMGVGRLKPAKIAHERALAAKKQQAAEPAVETK